MKKINKSHLVLTGLGSIGMFYTLNRASELYLTTENSKVIEKINTVVDEFIGFINKNPLTISMEQTSLVSGLIGFISIWLILVYWWSSGKNYMNGIEYGSAEWGDKKDIKKYVDKKNKEKNILFTQTEKMTIDTRKTMRNNNVCVVGGAGSGKTRFFVKPNLMQMHTSYVITDPKGSLLTETGKMLEDNGYKVKVFNLINMSKSDRYNPLAYIKAEKDILKLVNNLIVNTNPPNSRNTGDFWEKAEKALLTALIAYVYYEGTEEEKNLGTVMMMLRMAEVKEEDEAYQSPLDILFADLKEEDTDHFAAKQYDLYKLAAGKTAKSILVSIGVRLSPFYINELEKLVSEDTIELDMIGSEKTALYIILSDTDSTYNFVAAMMYQQLFDTLVYKADNEYGGRLPFHVRCLLDEFANIGKIPDFEKLIATIRSREISANIILQNLTQLKTGYKDSWETITGNCDTFLFLGGKEQSTLESVSKMIGKTTIDNRNINETKGQSGSYSLQYQVLGRDLITPDELGRLKTDECILSIRGEKPFKSRKLNIKAHKNYKMLSDYDKSNEYKFLSKSSKEIIRYLDEIKEVEEYTVETDLSELNMLSENA